MFKCDSCKKVSARGEKANKVVVETREREYQHDNTISKGSEIVKEITVCKKCKDLRK
jgi:hypothetical protein